MAKVTVKKLIGGQLPDKWKWSKLSDLSKVGIANGIFKRRHEFGSGIPIINVYDLYQGLAIDLEKVERVSVSDIEIKKYAVAPGDLFFCRSSLKREGIGWCAYISELPEPAVFDCHIMRVRPNSQIVLPEFIAYYWRHPEVRTKVIDNSRTSTMTTMNQRDLGNIPVPLPPISEQKKVVKVLNKQLTFVTKALTTTEAQLEAARALPAAFLRQLFNSPEAQKWPKIKLGDVLENIIAGKSVKCVGHPANPDEWGVLKVSAVSWGRFKPEENKALPEEFVPLPEHEVQADDLLISRANTTELVGAVVLVNKGVRNRLMLSDKTLRLIPTSQAYKGYLELALREKNARLFIEENGTGTSDSMKNISQATIKKIPIVLPPINKQIEIAEFYKKQQPRIEKTIQALQVQLDTVNQLPAALLRQAFNGEI